jgi:hypothetical protein
MENKVFPNFAPLEDEKHWNGYVGENENWVEK